jgi:DNA-binding NtrC family response regulator
MGEVDETLLGADWHVRRVTSVRELGCAIRDGVPKAGLIDFGSAFSTAELDLLERCLQASHVGWVAALPPSMLGHDRVRQLVRDYCVDYVQMPLRTEETAYSLRHAWGMATLAQEAPVPKANNARMLGECPAMQGLFRAIRKVAQNSAPAFIAGESGTGKELTAQGIHEASSRAGGPFIAINCGAIPPHLIQSELFGYEKGAFTGAVKAKRGYIEQAHQGTLFLDEIGEMPLSMQAKLLRTIQDRKFTRLGSEKQTVSDFRLVCATHRDLKAMVEAGQFREDLYYRIHVIHQRIPPLRERPEDIRWFVRHFVEEFNRRHPEEKRRIDPRTEQALLDYSWPGNVRELKHAVERACILSTGPLLGVEAFFSEGLTSVPGGQPVSESLADYLMACERDYLQMMLERHGNHMTRTAETLGITRKTLWEKLRRIGIKTKADEAEP